jgi:hypothetical protein
MEGAWRVYSPGLTIGCGRCGVRHGFGAMNVLRAGPGPLTLEALGGGWLSSEVLMTWNYRVMLREGIYAVHAVYYADDGRITDWSAEPMPVIGESVEELDEELERFRHALSQPVLDYEEPESVVPEQS